MSLGGGSPLSPMGPPAAPSSGQASKTPLADALKNKKRRLSEPAILPGSVIRPRTPVVGQAFTDGIAAIQGSRATDPVSTRVDIPFKYPSGKKDKSKKFSLTLEAMFSTKSLAQKETKKMPGGKVWMQGWMQMPGETSYEKVLPETMTLPRATVETRVMKRLVLGDEYKPKRMQLSVGDEKEAAEATNNWGRPAMQSFVEDITARTALHVQHVGSGMRAMLLASKLRMANGGGPESGFRDAMRGAFPQLLTKTTKGGASLLNDQIVKEQASTAGGATPTQADVWKRSGQQHMAVMDATDARFAHKWKEIGRGNMTTEQAGKWWVKKFGEGDSGRKNLLEAHQAGAAPKYGESYMKRKLARHGIADLRDKSGGS